jgi:hypothetical protein
MKIVLFYLSIIDLGPVFTFLTLNAYPALQKLSAMSSKTTQQSHSLRLPSGPGFQWRLGYLSWGALFHIKR